MNEDQWKWDDYDFELTAKALFIVNKGVAERYGDVASFIEWMKSQTRHMMTEPGFWGTAGFRISVCRQSGNPDGFYATASLSAYGVSKYLNIE